MSETEPVCQDCGAPANTHISSVTGAGLGMEHLCNLCANTRYSATRDDTHRRSRGVVLILVGSFVLFISLFADQLAFGHSDGFGWRQAAGFGVACLVFLIGTLVRVPALIVSGMGIGGVALLADWMQLGAMHGFGRQQAMGVLFGALMILVGIMVSRPHPHSHGLLSSTAT